MAEKILIIEDEVSLQETLTYNLQKQNYEVECIGDGQFAIETVRRYRPDLIVLDIMLPGLDGFEICRLVRQEISTPILMLTARDDEIDRVVGLEVGADDYLTKPFSMRELMARVKALLRRVRLIREEIETPEILVPTNEILRIGNLEIDITRREALINSQPLKNKPKEYELLLYFAQHRGQLLTRDRILSEVWGWEYSGDSRTVDVHVRWLREKIEVDESNPKRIITVRSAGYRFEG